MSEDIKPTRFKDLWNAKREAQAVLDVHREQVTQIVFDDLTNNFNELFKDPGFVFPEYITKWFRARVVYNRPTIVIKCGKIKVAFGEDEKVFTVEGYYDPRENYYTDGADDNRKPISWYEHLISNLNSFKINLANEMIEYKENFGKKCEI